MSGLTHIPPRTASGCEAKPKTENEIKASAVDSDPDLIWQLYQLHRNQKCGDVEQGQLRLVETREPTEREKLEFTFNNELGPEISAVPLPASGLLVLAIMLLTWLAARRRAARIRVAIRKAGV